MRSEDCRRVEKNLWRYIDRELSASQLADISAHLKACGACNALYESRARDAKLYRMAFAETPFGDGFVERFQRRLSAPPASHGVFPGVSPGVSPPRPPRGGGGSPRRGGRGVLPPQSPRKGELPEAWERRLPPEPSERARKLAGRLALAAALALIGALVIYGLAPGPALGKLQANGNLSYTRGDRALPDAPETVLPGDRIELKPGSDLTMTLDDGSRLLFEGPAEVRIEPTSRARGPFHAHLDEGRVRATVEPRVGRELRISSSFPPATAVVVGTEFTLGVKKGLSAMLSVDKGEVKFQGDPAYDFVLVNRESGPYEVRVDQGKPRRVQPAAAPSAVPSPPGEVSSPSVPEGKFEGAGAPPEAAATPAEGAAAPPEAAPAPAPSEEPKPAPPPAPPRVETDLPVNR